MGKDTNIVRKIYQSSRFYDNNAFWKLKIDIFQISAVRTGVCAYKGRYTPSNLRPALINGTLIKRLIQEALLICFVCDLRYFLFVCLFLHRFIKSF